MHGRKLERCAATLLGQDCCYFVDDRPVSKERYESLRESHAGNYGVCSGRNAFLEHIVGCRGGAR